MKIEDIKKNRAKILKSKHYYLIHEDILTILGIICICFGDSTFIIIYSELCIIGFSANSIASFRREEACKWSRHILTTPASRTEIVKFRYITHLLWTLLGTSFSFICILLTFLFHGIVFDVLTDVLLVFVSGLSIGLLMGALFFPLSYLAGYERSEVVLGMSIVGAIVLCFGLLYCVNYAFEFDKIDVWQTLIGAAAVLVVSIIAFVIVKKVSGTTLVAFSTICPLL